VVRYATLARRLGTDQPLYGLQAQGLTDDRPPHERVEDMATEYLQAIRTVQPAGPYQLAGWSLGGLVAFEMAQQLTRAGETVALLAVFDTWQPAVFTYLEDIDDAEAVAFVVQMMPHTPFDEQRALSADELRRRSPQDRLAYLAEAARQANYRLTADSSEGDTSRLDRYIRIYKSHGRATANYRPQVYPGRITFFQAESIVRADFRAAARKGDASSIWRDWSLQPLTVHLVPGDHDALMDEPYVGVLAEKLAASIAATEHDVL